MAFVELLTFAMATCSEEKIHLIIPEKAEGDIPVLYLLHGGSGNCDDWLLNSSIERYAEKKGIAVVMPSAGPSRWLKMAVGPDYEEYIIRELPKIVRRFFPRITIDPKHTYIGGLSMGGGGALELAIMYPEKFAAACILSTSSVVPLEHLRISDWTPPGPVGEGSLSLSQIHFGVDDPDEMAGTRYDIISQSVRNIKEGKSLPRIFHAAGMQDHGCEVTLAIRKHFMSLEGNPYRYECYIENATHCWEFWDKWIQIFLESVE